MEGKIVAAIDGTQILNSKKKKCDKCLTVNRRGSERYKHNSAVMSLIGKAPNLAIDFEMYKSKAHDNVKDEGEFTAAIRLLNKVVDGFLEN